MSVDILPSQVPRDASEHFSKCLMPYLQTLIRQYQGTLRKEDTPIIQALDRASIARDGQLQGSFTWLRDPLEEHLQCTLTGKSSEQRVAQNISGGLRKDIVRPEKKKKILLLGAGMVARPAIEEFYKRKDVQLVVG